MARSYQALMGRDEHNLDHEFEEVLRRLREESPEPTAVELDQIKLEARTRAMQEKGGLPLRRTRRTLVTALLALGIATSGGAVVYANHDKGQGKSRDNAAKGQYKPGKGCGDKNHVHLREGECKKPPK